MTDSTREVLGTLEGLFPSYGVLYHNGVFSIGRDGEGTHKQLTLAQARKVTGVTAPKRERRVRAAWGDYAAMCAFATGRFAGKAIR